MLIRCWKAYKVYKPDVTLLSFPLEAQESLYTDDRPLLVPSLK